jgi:rod shape determining protein RodA
MWRAPRKTGNVRNRILFGAEREVDNIYLITVLVLSLLGILLIFSARHSAVGETPYHIRQLQWLALSVIIFLIVIRIPLRLYEVFAYPILGLAVILLVAVLLLGRGAGGAVRWFDFGAFKFQPSEWAKLAVIIAAARFLSSGRPHSPWFKLGVLGLLCGIPALLVLRQPDLGTALVFGAIFLGLAVWAKIPAWTMALLLTPVIALIAASDLIVELLREWLQFQVNAGIVLLVYFALLVAVLLIKRPGVWISVWMMVVNLIAGIATPILWGRLHQYQKMRIQTFLDPTLDPHGAGYQIIQSKVAIGSGGLAGKGFLAGSQTHLKFLPAQHTDFVFAVLGEEFGLWGTTIVLTLFATLVLRGLWIGQKTRNRFGSYVAAGISVVLLFHILVNVGMTVGLFPVTGLPLPFLSYGGSFLLAMWVLVAFVVVVADRWQEY